jgi:MFS superfamily sulfate permease-like transporter
VAGVALTAVLVPAGMGYAQAAGLPAVTGLYASIAPLVAYALLGPSRILVLGPLAPTLGTAVRRYLADNDVEWTDWEDQDELPDA